MSTVTTNPEELNATIIGIDNKFDFYCTGCGSCCKNRSNERPDSGIFLSEADIRRISKYLNLSASEIIKKYIIKYNDKELGLTTCMMKFSKAGECSFLKNGKCSIYKVRPRTCALYPLGRGIMLSIDEDTIKHTEDTYYFNAPEAGYRCLSKNQYTVKEWLDKNDIPLIDNEDIEWHIKLVKLSQDVKRTKKKHDYTKNVFDYLYDLKK